MGKRLWILAAAVTTAVSLSACGPRELQTTSATDQPAAEQTQTPAPSLAPGQVPGEEQVAMPEEGQQVAVIHVKDYGDISVKFFPEVAPKAVENFVTHAQEGYYDNVTFHRVIDDFMIQGGDPTGTGSGGESIWKTPFEDEFSETLLPIYGALCMANSGENTNGSQFFIVQTDGTYTDQLAGLTDAQKKIFMEHGGTPWLVGKHTVFGQVYDGMDVVNAIAACETDNRDIPVEDVVIQHIDVTTYVAPTPSPAPAGSAAPTAGPSAASDGTAYEGAPAEDSAGTGEVVPAAGN